MFFLAGMAGLSTKTVFAAQDKLQAVLDDWTRRQQMMVGVRFVYEGDYLVSKGSLTGHPAFDEGVQGEIPPEDYTYKRRVVLLLDFERNRVRKEIREERPWGGDGRFYPVFQVQLYDGNSFQEYSPAPENRIGGRPPDRFQVELQLQTDHYSGFVLENSDFPLLFAHGSFPSNKAGISPKLLRTPIESGWYRFHGEASIEDQPCTILRTQTTESGAFADYWIDTGKQSAVARWIAYSKGKPTITVDISHQRAGESWVPKTWELSQIDSTGKLLHTTAYQLKELDANPKFDTNDFHMDRVPGMIVNDAATGRVYRVANSGEQDVDVQVLLAQEQEAGGRVHWAIVLLIALMLISGVGLVYWHRQKRPRANP
jgi:hypothetical protein